jgi:hypothetical protein
MEFNSLMKEGELLLNQYFERISEFQKYQYTLLEWLFSELEETNPIQSARNHILLDNDDCRFFSILCARLGIREYRIPINYLLKHISSCYQYSFSSLKLFQDVNTVIAFFAIDKEFLINLYEGDEKNKSDFEIL